MWTKIGGGVGKALNIYYVHVLCVTVGYMCAVERAPPPTPIFTPWKICSIACNFHSLVESCNLKWQADFTTIMWNECTSPPPPPPPTPWGRVGWASVLNTKTTNKLASKNNNNNKNGPLHPFGEKEREKKEERWVILIAGMWRFRFVIWFQTFLLFTKPHFQTFNALKSTSFQAFQTFSDFSHSRRSRTPCDWDWRWD